MARSSPKHDAPTKRNSPDKALLDLARRRFQQAQDATNNQRIRELDDIRFYNGARGPPGRAGCLALASPEPLGRLRRTGARPGPRVRLAVLVRDRLLVLAHRERRVVDVDLRPART